MSQYAICASALQVPTPLTQTSALSPPLPLPPSLRPSLPPPLSLHRHTFTHLHSSTPSDTTLNRSSVLGSSGSPATPPLPSGPGPDSTELMYSLKACTCPPTPKEGASLSARRSSTRGAGALRPRHCEGPLLERRDQGSHILVTHPEKPQDILASHYPHSAKPKVRTVMV